MIKRYYDNLDDYLKQGKVLVIYGPRQVGKTTLLKEYLEKTAFKYKLDSGDNISIQNVLSSGNIKKIKEYSEGYELIVIDEAQNIPRIGQGLKIIIDEIPGIRIIVTGSSSFDLAHQIGEPLTGRKRTLTLFPVAQLELLDHNNKFEIRERLEEFLIFGGYPEVITSSGRNDKISVLNELVNSYLYKDVLAFGNVRGAKPITDLVKLLAFQVGSEVSCRELSSRLGIDIKTVQRYLDILEKAFIIKPLNPLSRNLRKEISKMNKYYFYDNGIRNTVIAQYNGLDMRDDTGKLWENYTFIERLKKREYKQIPANMYFWKSYNGKEIDLVEEREGRHYAYECKWSARGNEKGPKEFMRAYDNAEYRVIHNDNYLDFII
ncbi:ATP-binding protein [Spirochaetota bacterium]